MWVVCISVRPTYIYIHIYRCVVRARASILNFTIEIKFIRFSLSAIHLFNLFSRDMVVSRLCIMWLYISYLMCKWCKWPRTRSCEPGSNSSRVRYIHFHANTLEKGINLFLLPPNYGLNSWTDWNLQPSLAAILRERQH